MPYIRADVKNVFGKQTYCKCPKCDKLHKRLVDWKGRGIPRMFCPECNHTISNMQGGIDDNSAFNRRAVVSNMVHAGRS